MASTKTTKRTTRTTSRGTSKSMKRGHGNLWPTAQVKLARSLKRQGMGAQQIGNKLTPRRTASAVRQKLFASRAAA